jgi:hypothetical protein
MRASLAIGRFERRSRFKRERAGSGRRFRLRARIARKVGVHAGALVARFRKVAPYALIIVLVPGGSLLAFVLWLYRRGKNLPIAPGR